MSLASALLMAAAGVEQPIDGQTGVWLKEGGVTISSGMSMTGAVVSSGQSQTVYSRGVAQSCIIDGGALYVSSGGTASGTIISGTSAVFLSGASIYLLTISGGIINLGAAPIGLITYGGNIYYRTNGGAVLSGATLSAGTFYCYEGVLSDTTIITGNTVLLSSGTASGAVVAGSGYLQLRAGTIASGVVVSSRGHLNVSSGASALAVTSNAGAIITVLEGGYIEYVTP